MAFHVRASTLFEEYIGLLGSAAKPTSPLPPLGSEDALVIIDMQADFVNRHPTTNPHGGRFGVAEGEHTVPLINCLIDKAVESGALIAATRDYHPADHCSFNSHGGPFPAHCIQGTAGSYFLPAIGTKLADAMRKTSPEKVCVVFKAFHEAVDSFGGLPYHDGGEGRISKGNCPCHPFGQNKGCAAAPFTGGVMLKQSGLIHDDSVDINAPPDLLAVLDDGHDRKARSLSEVLAGRKRIFVCGLALDFCVLDTCLNAFGSGFRDVYMIMDAARAAHIPGIGKFGTGFLSDPSEVMSKMQKAGIKLADTASLAAVDLSKLRELPVPEMDFPCHLAPLCLMLADIVCVVDGAMYKVEFEGDRKRASLSGISSSLGSYSAPCGPRSRTPLGWPGAPALARDMCWGYPLVSASGELASEVQNHFMCVSMSPEMAFLAYGGFLFFDSAGKFVGVQAVASSGGIEHQAYLTFQQPRPWRQVFTPALQEAKRFDNVTLPSLLRNGAKQFAWINPSEELKLGAETWEPSSTGAFVYVFGDGQDPIYFPVSEPKELCQKQLRVADILKNKLGHGDVPAANVKMLLSKLSGVDYAEASSLVSTFSTSETISIDEFVRYMWN
eukprot:TRINITY_DN102120_c0_g1_i1.p1 TRINITY_DN102120_c0_g1~~TRINITY_DN102120_c0_g1_i1.p1  ORF type:complete len:611 (-),score=81.33 TRINITY_DN102120_c0_g1_i1:35-1867(-)